MSLLKLLSVSALISLVAVAKSLPVPNASGDYAGGGAETWMNWQVLDPDPAGLNCRATPVFASGEWTERVYDSLPNNIGSFPVVHRFTAGTILRANNTPAGATLWRDDAGKNWVRVSLDDNSDAICFVRANKRYVHPVDNQISGDSPYSTTGEINPRFVDINFAWMVNDTDGLNCRVGPGTEFDVQRVIPRGTQVRLVDWSIQTDGKMWVAIGRGDSEFVGCWLRGNDEHLTILEY